MTREMIQLPDGVRAENRYIQQVIASWMGLAGAGVAGDLAGIPLRQTAVSDDSLYAGAFRNRGAGGLHMRILSSDGTKTLFSVTDAGVFASSAGATATQPFALVGMILAWHGTSGSIPAQWQICDGTNGTPDLRDRFIVGAGSTYALNATGGAATVSLAHTHTATTSSDGTGATSSDGTGATSSDGTGATGSSGGANTGLDGTGATGSSGGGNTGLDGTGATAGGTGDTAAGGTGDTGSAGGGNTGAPQGLRGVDDSGSQDVADFDHIHDGPSHAHSGPSHTHDLSGHTHTGPSHSHNGPTHTHTGPSHSHNGPTHTHTGPSHTHTGPSHSHTGPSHSHTLTTSSQLSASQSVLNPYLALYYIKRVAA